jgi:hypothetical protein
MEFQKLVPNIFYEDAKEGLKLFVDCLGFKITYNDLTALVGQPFCVIEKDGIKVHLVQSKEYAIKDRPELRLETKNIDEIYNAVSKTFPEFLHPNLNTVTLRPWKAKEFALVDDSGVCVIIQEWQN